MVNKRYVCRVRPPFCAAHMSPVRPYVDPAEILKNWYGGQVYFLGALRQGLEVLLRSLRPGKVVLSDFNCSSMLAPILRAGCVPYFVDVDGNFEYHREQLESVLCDDEVVAVIITHFFGRSAWTEELVDWAKRAKRCGIMIVEDCAHTLMDVEQPDVGRVGGASLFSFGNDKPLSVGKAGALVIREEALVKNIARLYRTLPVRDDDSEFQQLLWHVVFSWLARDEKCFPGLPCEAPAIASSDKRCNYEKFLQDVAANGPSVIRDFKLSREMLLSGKMQSQELSWKILRRLSVMLGMHMGKWKSFDLSKPVQMGPCVRNVLGAYLASGIMKEENSARSVMMKHISEILHCKSDAGSRLRFSYVFDSPALAFSAVQIARHSGVEAGGFNWRPYLSRLISQEREYPDWAVRPDCVVNFPLHRGVCEKDVQTIVRAVKGVNESGA